MFAGRPVAFLDDSRSNTGVFLRRLLEAPAGRGRGRPLPRRKITLVSPEPAAGGWAGLRGTLAAPPPLSPLRPLLLLRSGTRPREKREGAGLARQKLFRCRTSGSGSRQEGPPGQRRSCSSAATFRRGPWPRAGGGGGAAAPGGRRRGVPGPAPSAARDCPGCAPPPPLQPARR